MTLYCCAPLRCNHYNMSMYSVYIYIFLVRFHFPADSFGLGMQVGEGVEGGLHRLVSAMHPPRPPLR